MVTEPARQAWLEERRKGIGSSDAAIITGDSPWGSEYALAAEKRGLAEVEERGSPVLDYGRRVESVVAEIYAEQTGRRLERVNVTRHHPRFPELFAHPDRRVVGEKRLVECKTAWRPWDPDDVPRHYQVQVQHQMACTGAEVTDVALLAAFAEFRVYEVPRDEAVIAELVELELAWWARYVVGDEMPPLDDSAAARRHLDSLPGGPDMVASPEQVALMASLRRVRDIRDEGAADYRRLVPRIKESMAGSYVLVGPDFRVTWRPSRPPVSTDWKSVAGAYRKLLERTATRLSRVTTLLELPEIDFAEVDAIESLYTQAGEGRRPFRPFWMDAPESDEEAA